MFPRLLHRSRLCHTLIKKKICLVLHYHLPWCSYKSLGCSWVTLLRLYLGLPAFTFTHVIVPDNMCVLQFLSYIPTSHRKCCAFYSILNDPWEILRWTTPDWCRPIDADLLMPTFWCQSLLMPVPFDAQQARLMPDPIDVGLIHALSSKQFHFETLLRPGPIDARPSWCQLSLLMPVPIDARPHWCPFRLV